jgi:hypothetical protein
VTTTLVDGPCTQIAADLLQGPSRQTQAKPPLNQNLFDDLAGVRSARACDRSEIIPILMQRATARAASAGERLSP